MIPMIPTTDIPPVYVCQSRQDNIDNTDNINKTNRGGVEYKGKVYVSSTNSLNVEMSFSSKELWFIAKLHEKNNFMELGTIPYLAKIWATKHAIGCSYNKEIESMLDDVEQHIYCL